ncbi:hypothetical protein AWI43_21990 [Streptomyces sp. WAC04657]|nr:hypothetical protein AWI43_21990 [Streptomyces sp. WAC04657]
MVFRHADDTFGEGFQGTVERSGGIRHDGIATDFLRVAAHAGSRRPVLTAGAGEISYGDVPAPRGTVRSTWSAGAAWFRTGERGRPQDTPVDVFRRGVPGAMNDRPSRMTGRGLLVSEIAHKVNEIGSRTFGSTA